jgi:alcohol dehydrogenase
VLGDGRLGLLIAQVLHHNDSKVIVIGKTATKLHLARILGLRTSDLGVEKLPAASFSMVVDATGSPEALEEALRLVEPRGTVVMKSTYREPAHFDTAKLVVDEIRLVGSRCGNFSTALEMLRAGKIKVQPLISKTFPLSEGLEAFEYLNQKSCIKVLLAPDAAASK